MSLWGSWGSTPCRLPSPFQSRCGRRSGYRCKDQLPPWRPNLKASHPGKPHAPTPPPRSWGFCPWWVAHPKVKANSRKPHPTRAERPCSWRQFHKALGQSWSSGCPYGCISSKFQRLGPHGLQIGFKHFLILLGSLLNQILTILFHQLFHALRNFILVLKVGTQLLSCPNNGPHLNQVIHTLEASSLANRQLDWHRIGTQLVHHHLDILEEVGTLAVHLIPEPHAGPSGHVGPATLQHT